MNAIKRHIKTYLLLYTTTLFMGGVWGTRPLVSLYSNELGASLFLIGVLVGLFSLLPLLLSIKVGRWVDAVGTRIPMVLSCLFGSAALIVPFIYAGIGGIIISQLFVGLTSTMFVLTAQSFSANVSDDRLIREKSVALFSIGMSLGNLIGPFLGGITADVFGYPASFLILGTMSLMAFPLIMYFDKVKVVASEKSHNLLSTLKLLGSSNFRIAMWISVLVLFAREAYIAFFPLLADAQGVSATNIGLMIALTSFSGILIRLYLPQLVKMFTRNKVMFWSLIVSGSLYVLIPFMGNIVLLFVVAALMGIGIGIGAPVAISISIDQLPKDRVGEGIGLRLTITRVAQLSIPVVLGSLTGLVGLAGIFYVGGITILLGSLKTKITGEEK